MRHHAAGQRCRNSCANKWRRTGGGQHRCQHAGQKILTISIAAAKTLGKCRHREPHTVNQTECKNPDQDDHQYQKHRVLKLDTPPHRAAGNPYQCQSGRQQHEAGHDPAGTGQESKPHDPLPCSRSINHRGKFQRQHRQHTGHQIENKPTKNGDQHDSQKRDRTHWRGINAFCGPDLKFTGLRRGMHGHRQHL